MKCREEHRLKICILGVSKIAQCIKAFATKLKDLSLFPGTHTMERERQLALSFMHALR